MQGWRKRMEDSHLANLDIGSKKDTQLFGIFDGHGGTEVAAFVGHHFTEEFIKNQNFKNNDIKKALEENYLKMDSLMLEKEGQEELISEFKKSKEESNKIKENSKNTQIEQLREVIDPKEQENAKISMFTGCTANVLCIKDKKLYFANAGDSRSVIYKNGQAIAMSIDHKPELPNELKRIEKAGGWVSDGRVLGNLNLSRGLGDSEYKLNENLKPEEQIISAFPVSFFFFHFLHFLYLLQLVFPSFFPSFYALILPVYLAYIASLNLLFDIFEHLLLFYFCK